MKTDNYSAYKYYKGEATNPFKADTTEWRFWNGEKLYHDTADRDEWTREARRTRARLADENEDLWRQSNKYSDATFGIIIFIEELWRKNAPLENLDWVFKY